jgi:hypothetical protein
VNTPAFAVSDAARDLGAAWLRFWFTPADPRPLAAARIGVGLLGLVLLWSYAADLDRWFGAAGVVPSGVAVSWRSAGDGAASVPAGAVVAPRMIWAGAVFAYAAVLVGWGGSIVAVVGALAWSALLHRGPMLVGPADDCLAVLTWCVAVGPATATLSLDRWLAARRGVPAAAPSWRTGVSLGLVTVHASVIAAAAALAQLKGDVWWDGTAAWWLAARPESRLVDLTGAYAAAAYLMNLVTHAIPAFEIAFALGIWLPLVRLPLARGGLVAWPVIGAVVGEPWWGAALAVFCVPLAIREPPPAAAPPVSRRRVTP